MTGADHARAIELQRMRLCRRLVIFGALGTIAGLTLSVLGIVRGSTAVAVVGGIMAVLQIGVILVGLFVVRPRQSTGHRPP